MARTKNTISSATKKGRHNVYVIELSKQIWTDNWRFRKANPHYRGIKECLYVGMTSNTPKERFKKHKTGYRNKKGIKISSSVVQKYGLYLRPSLYSVFNPMSKADAKEMEESLANSLKKRGYAVWWN